MEVIIVIIFALFILISHIFDEKRPRRYRKKRREKDGLDDVLDKQDDKFTKLNDDEFKSRDGRTEIIPTKQNQKIRITAGKPIGFFTNMIYEQRREILEELEQDGMEEEHVIGFWTKYISATKRLAGKYLDMNK